MQKDLTKGSALKNIITFSLPFLLANFLQTFYGMADLFIVGQYNGAASLSGVSIGSQVMHMITVMLVGIAMGSTVMIGRYVGERKEEEKRMTVGNTIIIFMILSLIVTLILLFFINPIVSIMSTPVEAIQETTIYLKIWDSKSPMYFVAVACFFNIVLDFIFIGYFNMHAVGAAFGTVISQLISVIVALFAIIKRKLIVIHRHHFKLHKKIIKDIFKIGFPISMQDGLIQISFIIITIIANSRGVDIAAAVGVVEKIIRFLFLVPSSMLSAISAICAQCVGTKQHQRARQTLRYGCFIALGFGIFFALTCQFISKEILSLFTSEAAVIMYGSQYLKGYVLDCVFASIHFCFSGFFTAYGYSIISFIHNVISIALIRVPGAYITSKLFPETLLPMGLTPALGSILSALICITVFIVMKKKNKFDF